MLKQSRDVIRVIALAFAMLILQSGLSIAQVSVSLPNLAAGPAVGSSVVLPVTVSNLTGKSVIAYQFTLAFDTSVVKITGYDVTETISSGINVVSNLNTPGQITIGAYGTNSLAGAGTLIKLTGTLAGTKAGALTMKSFAFNNGTPTATAINGSLNATGLLVSVPTMSDTVGATVTIAVNADSALTGKAIYAYQFVATYDTSVLQLTGQGYSTTGTLSAAQGISVSANSTPGTISIAAFGTSALTGKGALINLTGKIVKTGTTPVALGGFVYNGGTPVAVTSNGTVTGTAVNHKPHIVSVYPLTLSKLQLGSSVTFSVTATDPDAGDTLSYTWSVNNKVKQTGSSNIFMVTPDSGTDVVKAVVADQGGLKDSTSWSFLVTAVNSPLDVPTVFSLGQNYPNPFNPTTVIAYDVPKLSTVRIVVYDILGREVRMLVDNDMAAGHYHVTWDGLNDAGRQVTTGIYFYRMQADNFVSMKKMLLMK